MITRTVKNEQGFVLIVSLLMLVVLMIIGIAATTTTTIELQISGNDKVSKQTFYQAEAGTQVGAELVERCSSSSDWSTNDVGTVHINNLNLCQNTTADWSSVDAYFVFGGETELLSGSATQMAAGYEGKGKSAASGGAVRKFDIRSHHVGRKNSNSTVQIEWDSFL